MIYEIIVTNLAEALLAESCGASRLELIHSFELGGLSPALTIIKDICDNVQIPVNIMVRPHGDSFIFNDNNMQSIFREIDYIATNTKASGVVFGSLTENKQINITQLEQVLKFLEKTELSLTYHRAIDESNDVVENFRILSRYINNGLKRVLSSGGADTAINGLGKLKLMQQIALSSSLILLPGSGINQTNIKFLLDNLSVHELHIGTGVRMNGKLDHELLRTICGNKLKD